MTNETLKSILDQLHRLPQESTLDERWPKNLATIYLDGLARYAPMHDEFNEEVARLARILKVLADVFLRAGQKVSPPLGTVNMPNVELNALHAELADAHLRAGDVRHPGGTWVAAPAARPKREASAKGARPRKKAGS